MKLKFQSIGILARRSVGAGTGGSLAALRVDEDRSIQPLRREGVRPTSTAREPIGDIPISHPPLYVLPFLRPRGESATAVARRFYAAEAWRGRSWLRRLSVLSALARWPLSTLWNVAKYTSRNGAAVESRTGRGPLHQAFDQLRLGILCGMSPREYYTYELFRADHRARASQYFSKLETNGDLVRIVESLQGRGSLTPSSDKEQFAAQCRNAGLPVTPILWIASRAGIRQPVAGTASAQWPPLPPQDLFFKPARSSIRSFDARGPFSAEGWSYVEGGHYRGQRDELLTAEELLAHARARCTAGEYMIQPRLQNHPAIADLSNGALCSVTIQTFLNEEDRPEVVAAVLHLAVGRNKLTDNASLGGLIAAVDLATGTVGPATGSGKSARSRWVDTHPDTGAAITGRRLPLWSEALELAHRAHAIFSDRLVIGWDIALTPEGPLLLEADPRGLVLMKQRAYRRPFGEMRYGELLAHHIGRIPGSGRQVRTPPLTRAQTDRRSDLSL